MRTTSLALESIEDISLPDTPDYSEVRDFVPRADYFPGSSASTDRSSLLGTTVSFVATTVERVLKNHLRAMRLSQAALMPASSFIPLQKWEGVVEEVDSGTRTFGARLIDRSASPMESDFAEGIPLDDVDPDDLPLVQPGAIFYWTIGYRGGRNQQRVRESRIRFQRLPISTGEFQRARAAADQYKNLDLAFRDYVSSIDPAKGVGFDSGSSHADSVAIRNGSPHTFSPSVTPIQSEQNFPLLGYKNKRHSNES